MISSLTLLMNSLGLRTEWRVIQGTADFFSITKKMHNALQGGEIDLSSLKREILEQVIYENSLRNFLEHDFVIVHDPQPLPLIEHYKKKCPWLVAISIFPDRRPIFGNICGVGSTNTMRSSSAVPNTRRR
jgi:trehalose synthase